MLKRILSLVTAICLTAALLPSDIVAVGAVPATGKYTYAFGYETAGVEAKARFDSVTYATTGDLWRYYDGSDKVASSQVMGSRIFAKTTAVGEYAAIGIKVPADGVYNVDYTFYAYQGRGCCGDVYLLPNGTNLSDLTAAKAAGTKIASVDYSTAASSGLSAPITANNVELSAGENILLFVVTGAGANAEADYYYWTYPASLVLTDTSTLPPTELSGVKASYALSNNSALSDGEIRMIVSGESAADVFPSSDTDGWSAYCYSAGAEYIREDNHQNITLTQKNGEYMQISIKNTGEWAAFEIPVPKRGVYNGFLGYKLLQACGAADVYMLPAPEDELSEAEKREYVNEALESASRVASINCNDANALRITDSPETAEFTFASMKDNCRYLLVLKTTAGRKLLLDKLTLDGTEPGENMKPAFHFNFNTQAGIAGNSNPLSAKYSDTLNTWEGFAGNVRGTPQTKDQFMYLVFSDLSGYAAFKINLPATDAYYVTLRYYKHATAGDDGDVYILPGDTAAEDIPTALSHATKLASASYYSEGSAPASYCVTDKTELSLSKGEYILVFKATAPSQDKNFGTYHIYPGRVSFVRKSAAPPYSLIAEDACMSAGQTTELSLSDGEGNKIESFSVKSIVSSDESIASVDGTTVTARESIGRARLDATVEVAGEEISASGYVRVVNDVDSGASVTANVDRRNESWINPGYLRDPSLYKSYAAALNDIGGFEPGDAITEEFTDGWSWYGDNVDGHSENAFAQTNKSRLSMRMYDGEWVAFKMSFESSGHYRAIINHRKCAVSPYADMYFIPVPGENETVADYLTDEYKLGRLICYDPEIPEWNSPGSDTSSYVGDAYVDAPGDYLLVTQMAGREETGNIYLYFHGFVFSGANPIVGVGGSFKEALMVGETTRFDKSMVTYDAPLAEYRDATALAFENLTPEILTVTDDGIITGNTTGVGKIKVTATYGQHVVSGEYSVVVGSGKQRRSYYTDEKVKNAIENIKKYDWAKSERDSYVKAADVLLEHGVDVLYNFVTTQELPRAQTLAYRFGDTGAYTCLYCGEELSAKYTAYPWVMNPYRYPWKLQCPDCKRIFPSNDFGSFYKLGIDEHGNWDYDKALAANAELVKNGEDGYLVNKLYPEVGESLGIPQAEVAGWAVDDGYGFKYEYETASGLTETRCKPFVAYYNAWGLWETEIPNAIHDLGMAYLYTGEAKYGRAGAVLLDRVADVYPDFDTTDLGPIFQQADGNIITLNGGASRGRVLGRLHDCNISQVMVPAYDALWPALKDEWVIKYLSEKSAKMGLDNPKSSALEIAANIENNYIREIDRSVRDYRLSANFGVPEKLHITAAVVLDTLPETQEWIKFVFQSGEQIGRKNVTGGNVYAQLMDVVDRDGHGNEASPSYNSIWINNMLLIGEALDGYDNAGDYDLYKNPKLRRMLTSEIDLVCASTWSPNIADFARIGTHNMSPETDSLIAAYRILDGDKEKQDSVLRVLYHTQKGVLDNVHGSIFETNPEAIKKACEALTKNDITVRLPSRDLTGYGFAILRDGEWLNSINESRNINTQRDFYIYYGQSDGHGHCDKLTLGFHAYGFDMGSDLGTPRLKNSTDPQRFELVNGTISHNTVMVNSLRQRVTMDGNPMHFDATDRVQVMDVEAPEVYDWLGVEEYRRTLVMVDASSEVSYGVDFFHILGGEKHTYSFHAFGREAELSENVAVAKQTDEDGNYIGSYEGIDKPWGASSVNSVDGSNKYGGKYGAYEIDRDLGGTTDGLGSESWFGEVDRAVEPQNAGVFSADWRIDDVNSELAPPNNDMHLRLTMLPSFKLDEITTASVLPPQLKGAIDKVRYMFASHSGAADGKPEDEKLDSLFTAVVEPYDGERYIKSIEPVEVKRADGAEFATDEAKAVIVTLVNGREDYIIYAKDNTVPYVVSGKTDGEDFDFCGFVGVISVMNGKIIYKYLNDGTTIADKTDATAAFTGTVTGFEKAHTEQSYIDVELTAPVDDLSVFKNKYIYVDNGLSDNGAYRIEGASRTDSGVRLDIGDTTLITGYVDDYDFDKGYNYNIEVGDGFSIPMSYVDNLAPVFVEIPENISISAGSSTSVSVAAESPIGASVTLSPALLPRGASFDSESCTFNWKPDSSQIGSNVVSIDAVDEYGRVTTAHFNIKVLGATSGGGGGGGGGGEIPTDPTEPTPTEPTPTEPTPTEPTPTEPTPTEPTEPTPTEPTPSENERFTDLGGFDWARDAITILADSGVINGMSDKIFAPGARITRADFAILLVRAFELSGGGDESFADVSPDDYFAAELSTAKSAGIVGGIGDNKYAPRRAITREDMMVIIYRALTKLGYTLSDAEGLSAFSDADEVSGYAIDAVATLIANDLITGANGKISPKSETTRAEVAVLLNRILSLEK